MEDFLKIVMGDMKVPIFLGYFFLAMLGALGRVAYRANQKAKKATGTPEKFDWAFFIKDNWPKWVISILGTAFAIRFSTESLGQEMTGYGALLYGAMGGQLSIWAQGRSNRVRKKVAETTE